MAQLGEAVGKQVVGAEAGSIVWTAPHMGELGLGRHGAAWIEAHCADYGFIIRYPAGKEDITGFMYEPWHVRYVGKELARTLTDQGLTLEEYFGIDSVYYE